MQQRSVCSRLSLGVFVYVLGPATLDRGSGGQGEEGEAPRTEGPWLVSHFETTKGIGPSSGDPGERALRASGIGKVSHFETRGNPNP